MTPRITSLRASRFIPCALPRAASARLAFLIGALPLSTFAAPYTWDGGGANGNWGTVGNWVGDPAPVFDNTADLTFYAPGTTTQLTNYLSGNRTVRSLVFSADADSNVSVRTRGASGSAQSSRTLAFDAASGNASLTVDAGSSGAHAILGGAVTAINLGGSITLTDSLDVVHNGSGTLTLGQNNDGVFAGSETPLTGAGALNKSGTGVLLLAGPNTFAGGVNLTQGRLQVTSNAALGTGPVSLAGTGSELRLSVNGVSTPAANSLVVGDAGDAKILSGLIAGGATTFGGAILIEETTPAAFEISAGTNHTFTVSGNITGTTPAGVKKSGTGVAIVSGNNTYSGDTLISNGTLRVGAATALPGGSGAGNVEVAPGGTFAGTLDLNGLNLSINGLVGGNGTFLGQVVNNTIGTATLTVGGAGATATFSGVIKDNSGTGGAIALAKTGAGIQTLAGVNTYSGGTTILAGRLDLRNSSAAGSGEITLDGAGAELTLGTGMTLANDIVVTANGDAKFIRFFDTGGLLPTTISGAIISSEDTDGDFGILVGSGATLTLSGSISGTGGLKKSGAGNLVVTSSDITYSGITGAFTGTLTLANPVLDDLSPVYVSTGATLNLTHASTDTISGLFIDGVQSPAGLYKAVGAGGDGTELAVLAGTGKLQVTTSGESFSSWMAGYTFDLGADVSAAGDADKDGVANLIEHVLGTAPNAASSGIASAGASSTSFTFTHPLNPAIVSGVTYGYQWSTDLAEWNTSGVANTGGVVVTIAPSAPVADVVTVAANVTTGTTTKLFTRIVATLAP